MTVKQPIHRQAGLTSPSIISNDRMDLITASQHPTTATSLYMFQTVQWSLGWMLYTLHKEKTEANQLFLRTKAALKISDQNSVSSSSLLF